MTSKKKNINNLRADINKQLEKNNSIDKNKNHSKNKGSKINFDEQYNFVDINFTNLIENLLTGFSYHEIIFDKNNKPTNCKYLYVNKKFEEIIGLPKSKIIGKTLLELQPGIEPFWMELYSDVALYNKTFYFDHYSVLLDKYLQVNSYSPEKGKFITIFNDITDQKRRENKISKTNKALKIFGEISSLISEKNNIQNYYSKICQTIIKISNYKYVWIGEVENNNISKTIECGELENFAPEIIHIDNTSYENDCTACLAVKTNKIVATNWKNINKKTENWLNSIKPYNINSAISIPIFFDKKIKSILNIFSSETDDFMDDEIEIYQKLSINISNGLNLISANEKLNESVNLLEENIEKINATLNALPDLILEVKNNKIIDYYSSNYNLPYTPSKHELIGKNIENIYPQEISDKYKNTISKSIKTNKIQKFEFSLNFDKTYYFEATISPKKRRNNETASAVILIKNITSFINIQNELSESEEKFRSIVENSPVPIALISVDGKTKYVNSNFVKLFGYKLQDIPDGRKFNELVFPDDNYRDEVNRDWAETVKKIKKGIIETREYDVTCKNGIVKNIQFKLVNLDSENSLLFFNDLTSIRNAFKTIVESEQNLKVTLNSIGDAVIVTDKFGKIIRMNPVAEKLTGYKIKTSLGKNIESILNIINSKTGLKAENPVEKVLRTGKIVGLANHTELISKNGRKYHIDDSAAPIINDNKEIIGVVMVFHDISEKYLLNEKNKETTRKLQHLLANLPGLVYRCANDENWSMEFLSEGVIELTGFNPDEIISNCPTFSELIIPEHKDIVWQNVQNSLKLKKPFQLTYKIKCKDNTIKWVWENGSGVYDEKGNLQALEGFIYDITDEKLANQKLYESEIRFATAFKSSPNGICITDSDGIFIEVNDKLVSLLEYSNENEIIGKSSFEIKLWNDLNDRNYFIDTIYKNGEIIDFISKFNTKNGKIIICQISAKTIEIDNKELIITIASDITEKIKAQEELEISEKRYKKLLSSSPFGIMVIDENDFKILYANQKICEMLNYTVEELKDKLAFEIHPEEVRDKMNLIINKHINTSKDIENYIPLITKDNKIIYCDINTNNIIFNGEPCLIGFFNDVSDRKQTEDALKNEYVINQSITKLAKELMSPTLSIEHITELTLEFALKISKSKNGYITTIDLENGNNVIHSFSNQKDSDEINSSQKVVLKKNHGTYPGLRGISLNTKKPYFINNLKNEINNFKLPEWHVNIKNFLSVPAMFNELLLGQISVANSEINFNEETVNNIQKLADIYAIALYRKLSEEQLIKAKQKAEESDRLKTNFLENMSHEIRTPMNGIIGFSELLKEKNINQTQREEYIGFISNSCNVLSNLIDDIIDISKIEAGQIKIEKSEFSLDYMLYELYNMYCEEKIRKNKINVDISFVKPENIKETRIFTDQYRLRQIISNLLGNALKFTDLGFIKFGYKIINRNDIEIFVQDTGVGIPDEKLEIVFERFRQVDETPKRSYGGAGLGLAISKNLTQLLDGNISVSSEFKKGSIFTLKFKNIISNKNFIQSQLISEIEGENINLSKHTILVVEDDQINSILIQEILKKTQVKVISVYNGNDAILEVKNNNIDLVLMDIQLPGINGYEAMDKIKKIKPELPVIAQTAYAMIEEKNKLLSSGFDDYIIKPINIDKLLSAVNNYLVKK